MKLKQAWLSLYAHYRDYHAYGPPRLKYMGYLGVGSLVLFYFLRFTRPNAQLFDDIVLRGLAILMLALLALKDQWPEKLKRYYIAYSYFAVLYSLPCFTVLVALQRGGGVPAMSNAFIILCFLVLLTDWRNTLVMLTVGTGSAALIYWATAANPKVPMDLVAQIPAYALIVLGGNLFKFSTEQIDTERKLRATQALAGSIAHELRHPLAQIKHSLGDMQQVLPAPGAAAQPQLLDARGLDALYRHLAQGELAVKRGLQVISMTLDEVSAKPIDTAAFSYLSAAEVTEKAVQEYGYETDEARRRVTVEVQEDFSFRGDETAYLFVLFNLIKNALYYLGPYPDTRVRITVGQNQVKVRDNGPGIAPEALAGLFEPFRSVGKTGGTGLGLAYCQRVMRAFGGEIRCQSEQGNYTEFTMQFPPASEVDRQAQRDALLVRTRHVLEGKRLLLVEDDMAQRITTQHKLRPLGLVIDEAADGSQALQLLGRNAYDLVLLDLNMPVVDGYALAERVRQGEVPANREVRIVAHTSEPAHIAMVKTHRAGMDGFVSKPSAQLTLASALVQVLSQPVARPLPEGQGPLAGLRVLLADDSAFNRRAVSAYLRSGGAAVLEASHGQAVLDALQADGVDVVLMDLNMPGMDGMQTTRSIRQSERPWAQLPVIALTAHSDQGTIQAALAAGMNGYLVKPVEAVLLYETLLRLTGRTDGPSAAVVPEMEPLVVPAGDSTLLNLARLDSYRRLGLLEELLNDYLPEMSRLVEALQASALRRDRPATLDALHSLLGMSGEAGAQALSQRVRRIYVPMLEEGRWPEDGWVQGIVEIARETEQALRAHGGAPSEVRV